MKRAILIACLAVISIDISAQSYQLTPEGLVTPDKKEYIVVDVPNTKATELYKILEKDLSSIFPPAKTTFYKNTDGRIIITTAALDLFRMNAGLMLQYIMDIEYTIIIDVKDYKFRITPIINLIGTCTNFRISRMVIYDNPKNHKDFTKKQFIFNYKNRAIQNEKAKTAIEKHINEVVSKIINIKSHNEDW